MKIKKISLYEKKIPMKYEIKLAQSIVKEIDCRIVKIETDTGTVGWGESVPWGNNYLPAYPEGISSGIPILAPLLIGENPLALTRINQLMDDNFSGHLYIKSALDMACWDILGKASGLPCYELLGGNVNPEIKVAASVPPSPLDPLKVEEIIKEWRTLGIWQFSAKASGNTDADVEYIKFYADKMQPGESLKLDCNRSWILEAGLRAARMIGPVNLILEQPCDSYHDCRRFRRVTGIPVSLDECIVDITDLSRAWSDGVLDAVNLKTGRVGGITKMKLMRDYCAALNIPMHIQETGAGDIAQAAMAHIAHSTPEKLFLSIWNCVKTWEESYAEGTPEVINGGSHMKASAAPGLGVEPIIEKLGEPAGFWD